MDKFPEMTDYDAIRFMLLLPWSVGDVSEDGEASYSSGEIDSVLKYAKAMHDRITELEARLVSEVPGPHAV